MTLKYMNEVNKLCFLNNRSIYEIEEFGMFHHFHQKEGNQQCSPTLWGSKMQPQQLER